MQRLDKFLSDAKVASRKELRQMIRAGRVRVNGAIVTDNGARVDEYADRVEVDGALLGVKRTVTIMLHKPAGYLSAVTDSRDKTIMELIPEEYQRLNVMPVGRLDKATEGLLLLTNDGQLNHRLLSPRHGVWKTYYCEHEGIATESDVRAFARGLVLSDGLHCLPAELIPQGLGKSLVRVQEGKFHQVRRMMASRQMAVTYLKRLAEGSLSLGGLPLGQVRELTEEEVAQLTRCTEGTGDNA